MVTPFSSSDVNVNVGPKPKVFINFRGVELRKNFISYLYEGLRKAGINAYMDDNETAGEELQIFFQRIEESKIALAVLSSKYTESDWCLQELVKIMECSMDGVGCNNNLLVIPILYKLKASTVTKLDGAFGVGMWNLWRKGSSPDRDDRIVKWNKALEYVLKKKALIYDEKSRTEADFLNTVVKHVQNALEKVSGQRGQNSKPQKGVGGNPNSVINQSRASTDAKDQNPKQLEVKLDVECNDNETRTVEGNLNSEINQSRASENTEEDQRLKQLEVKLRVEYNDNETRIVGVVGMPGIGKTYLAEKIFVKLKRKIANCVFIRFECGKSQEQGSEWLQKELVRKLLDQDCTDANALEVWKNRLIKNKVVIVFDNVSDLKQIEPPLETYTWIKDGSRIIITTRDKSLIEGFCTVLYEVPGLNEKDGSELFRSQVCCTLEGSFMELSRKFVEYAGGNPSAIMEFGKDLKGKEKDQWEASLGTLAQHFRTKLRICYDELNEQQKDAFLDIACFFRSQDENYVSSLLDSYDPKSPESGHELKNLADKFLIDVCDGRIEMHDLLFTMAKELLEATAEKSRLLLSNSEELRIITGGDKVRGIVIDMSNMEEMALRNDAFVDMCGLRYLKVYSSLCPTHSETECKLNLPDGVDFPKDNIVRSLHWVKFPEKELPLEFEPKNLIDLRLPYSNLTRLWNCTKVAPNLKWVDLSYSSNLDSLFGLSKAPNLLRLNLEGCTSLKDLSKEMQEMRNLIFLNLRGCTSLLSLPKITMNSLKTLILSGCSKFHTFEVISEHLKTLYLDGTAIRELPSDCLEKLKSLQDLKLSHCSELKSFLSNKQNMVKLRVLLLDETSIAEMPSNIINSSWLWRLCLSRIDTIGSIVFDMDQLFHLKWLELEYCRNLSSLSRLPPNLQCLNAHGCTSLRTLANPLALLQPIDQIHSTFIFTNCHELEQVSKNSIMLYVQKKSKLMSHDRYNQNFVFKSLIGTCFPGCEIPACFNHQALGPVLNLELPQGWNAGRLIGIALCVVVSFKGYNDQHNSIEVKCTCEFINVPLSSESFVVGGWSEGGDEPHMVKADHILIGYTTLPNIKKRQPFSSTTEASLRFEVTNGTREVEECKVVKCGFSLVYTSNEAENTSWEETTWIDNNIQDQRSSFSVVDDADPINIQEHDDGTSDATPTSADNKSRNTFLNRKLFNW